MKIVPGDDLRIVPSEEHFALLTEKLNTEFWSHWFKNNRRKYGKRTNRKAH